MEARWAGSYTCRKLSQHLAWITVRSLSEPPTSPQTPCFGAEGEAPPGRAGWCEQDTFTNRKFMCISRPQPPWRLSAKD